MMQLLKYLLLLMVGLLTSSCNNSNNLDIEVYETSEKGNQLTKLEEFAPADSVVTITINPDDTFQEITGFGGSFTEASAYLMNELSEENRNKILEAYFGESGARYSLTRTHINSSDFSLGNYSYA
ncbi:MAG: glycosyl hydrolase family 30, partial [Gracilimonas sp.]